MRPGTLRQISVIAFFSGNRKDFSTRFECSTHARRRKCGITDHARDFFELRSRPGQISGHLNVQSLLFSGCSVDEIYVTGLFINNRVRTSGGSHDIEVVVMRWEEHTSE